MLELNKVLIVGRLTRDPETRAIPSGASVASFGIAVNRRRGKDKEDEVAFIDCEAWDRQADFISQWFTKGKGIFIEGHLKMDRWQDKTTGANMSKLKIVVDRASFDGSPKADDADESAPATHQRAQASKASTPRPASAPAPARQSSHYKPDVPVGDDDLPF